jgi:5'-phosphate synthase pdxT subunit
LRVGVLAVQGDFHAHAAALRRCGVEAHNVRTAAEIADCAALIIPGGESTTIGKLIARYGLLQPIKDLAASRRPILGTCAGMILMAESIEAGVPDQPSLGLMDITVARNAFGRQIDSFEADLDFAHLDGVPVRAVFIRAPIIKSVGKSVEVLATYENRIVAARHDKLLALAFHPELTSDARVHQYFLSLR